MNYLHLLHDRRFLGPVRGKDDVVSMCMRTSGKGGVKDR